MYQAVLSPEVIAARNGEASLKIRIDDVELKADAMASGSPKGRYATLVALEAALPTGDTGAYLVEADSLLYFWDMVTSAWVDGGEYNVAHASKVALTDAGDYYDAENVETALAEVGAELSDIAGYFYATDYGVTPDSASDQTPYLQAAVDAAISAGGGTVKLPSGTIRIIGLMTGDDATTCANPKRVEIRGTITGSEGPPDTRVVNYVDDIHIVGNPDTIISMDGLTAVYLNTLEDPGLSGLDVFTAFSFCYARHCSVSNVKIIGEHEVDDPPLYYVEGVSAPRAKGVGFFGSSDCAVYNAKSDGILGDFVHSVAAGNLTDGYWMACYNITTRDCDIRNSWLNGVNHMGGSYNQLIENCFITGCDNSMETPGKVTNNLITYCKTGMALYGPAIAMGNEIKFCTQGFVSMTQLGSVYSSSTNAVFSDNIVDNCDGAFIYIYPGNGNILIAHNRFTECNLVDGYLSNKAISMTGTLALPIKRVSLVDNYFDVTSGYCTGFMQAVYLEDCTISGNIFNITPAGVAYDIYFADGIRNKIINNSLSKGISLAGSAYRRNLISHNNSSVPTYPIESDYRQSYVPPTGWVLGDIIRTTPVATIKGGQVNLAVGFECIKSNPLTWRKITNLDLGEWDFQTPTAGNWPKGRIAFNTSPVVGGNASWTCVLQGTFGTLNGGATTSSALTGTPAVSFSSLTGIAAGVHVKFADILYTVYRVLSVPYQHGATTVDVESASGQAVLSVTATTNFLPGETVAIGRGTAGVEIAVISSVQAGVSLTLTTNLVNTHAVSETVSNCALLDANVSATITDSVTSYATPVFAKAGIVDLQGSATWDPGSLADGVGETSAEITVTGAALGDYVLVSAPYDLQGITCTAYVNNTNKAKIRLQNETGGTIDLASGTWKVKVIKA